MAEQDPTLPPQRKDVWPALLLVYGPNAVYVDSIEENGVGHVLVTAQRIEEGKLRLVQNVTGSLENGSARVGVTLEHCKGHLDIAKGLPQMLPLHKGVRAVDQTVQLLSGRNLRLDSVDTVAFEGLIAPGNTIEIFVQQQKPVTSDITVNGTIVLDGETVARFQGMHFVEGSEGDDDVLQADQEAEIMAQLMSLRLGFAAPNARGVIEGGVYDGFKGGRFIRSPRLGEDLIIMSEATRDRRKLTGRAWIQVGQEVLAEIGQIDVTVMSLDSFRRAHRRFS